MNKNTILDKDFNELVEEIYENFRTNVNNMPSSESFEEELSEKRQRDIRGGIKLACRYLKHRNTTDESNETTRGIRKFPKSKYS